ncbi:immunoglobulin domain-containing protein Bsg [Lycorma delicatula]|uniref:immunoglobulin domain-containing protein Bsg n=1 Tax=Lycorma delicatula TaxID=130591 RepID=UPI003F51A403
MFFDLGKIYDGNSTVKEGDPFLIICRLSLSEAVEWQKDSVPIVNENKLDPHDYLFEEKEDPEIKNFVFAHLRVKSARPLHSGTYRCHSSHTESHQLIVESDNTIEATYDFPKYKVLKAKDLRLVLECNVTESSSSNHVIKWTKEGVELKPTSEEFKQIEIEGGKVTFKRPNWDDVGHYTCSLYNGSNGSQLLHKAEIEVIAKPYLKIHPNELTFVEGEELKIECIVFGRPTPHVIWRFENETYNDSTDRVKITSAVTKEDSNILKSYFILDRAQMSDRGSYSCLAQNAAVTDNPVDREMPKATCYVRIKDKYAALWPFLGICVEVVVLCTIIFIYEKKRNKAELEESDTDQSPEQKNTPDHGKESVRQRK